MVYLIVAMVVVIYGVFVRFVMKACVPCGTMLYNNGAEVVSKIVYNETLDDSKQP
jgi:hypothetical protein